MHEQLANLAADYWAYTLERSPTEGFIYGNYDHADQMEDVSRAGEDATIERLNGFADAAEALDRTGLTPDERVTRAVLIEEARGAATELSRRHAEFAVDHTMGFHVTLLQLVPQLVAPTPEIADALVGKWSKLGHTFDDLVKRLRQGIARDRTPPRIAVERTIAQIDDYLESSVSTDPFALAGAPEVFDATTEDAWRERLRETVRDVVRPAYAAYRNALRNEVLPKAREPEESGVRWLADGEEVYADAIRRHTSLDLTPLDIHQIGLDEIALLEAEYRELGARVLGTSDVNGIYDRLRNDPDLRFCTAAEIVDTAQSVMDRAAAAIPEWFGRLPQTDCVMAEIPQGAEDGPLAYYLPPAVDGSRPGTYFINTTDPTSRTRFEAEALAFHESIPGHHLQLAIAQELENIPDFRKHALVTVYVEGWGLYTERLADEMGLYTDDLTRLGILSFDSWRAGRLVVDTGMHALGWSRQEAIDWMAANSPQAPNNIANEVDRYIAWPGQALAYKIGQREIFRLRRDAESMMGDRFDIRGFHDVVLGSGPVPLGVLGELVGTWAAS
ncbi:MAG: DUF885 domain-containing protein [Acidimicrobiia bacterium]|nr:DUF885 domain-containing protein [Acidimicrobiia bacterium]